MVGGKIGVKFCGGCNPEINRSRIYKELQQRFPELCGLIRDKTQGLWDVGILLCGCPVACADSVELRRMAHQWILVGGTLVDLYPVDEEVLIDEIAKKCILLMRKP